MDRQCPKCNKPFSGRKTGAVYCSERCKRLAGDARRYQRIKHTLKLKRVFQQEANSHA